MRASRAGFFCRLLLTTICLSAGSLISAQNLIPNPGFEEYTTDCSSGVGYTQLSQWTYPECSFWSEMYAECNNGPAPWAGVPTNFEGEQEAHSGGAYCGLITYNSLAFQGNQRYYPSILFATPLVEGEEYCVRMWLSLSDSSSYSTGQLHCFLWYGIPAMCNFQDTAWDTYAALTLNTPLVGSDGWTLIEGSFVASGAEASLTLGYFSNGEPLDTTFIAARHQPYHALYFIDDVYLGPCDNAIDEGVDHRSPLTIWPDPVSSGDRVNLRLGIPLNSPLRVAVLDMSGRTVWTSSIPARVGQISIDPVSMKPGTYVVNVDHSGRCNIVRLVVL